MIQGQEPGPAFPDSNLEAPTGAAANRVAPKTTLAALKSVPPAAASAPAASVPPAATEPASPPKSSAAPESAAKNIVLSQKPDVLTREELEIVEGLTIADVHLPDRRGLLYFHLDTSIDNESPKGVIEKQLSVDVRVYCVDADGKANVTKFSKPFDLGAKGPQKVGLGGKVELSVIKLRNNNDETPKNVYIAFKINQKTFREIVFNNTGGAGWWRLDDLVKE
jgi:hypothetical protein